MLGRRLLKAVPFDRSLLIRHLGLCAAALVAYAARETLRVGNSVLWIFGFAALLNLTMALISNRPRVGSVARILSPVFGLGGWTALMLLTGGVASPFIAGLSLEIILAAVTTPVAGIALVTGGTVAGLWAQQIFLGLDGFLLTLTLQSGFLLIMGGLTCYAARRWRRVEEGLAQRQAEQRGRLEKLERELDEARTVGKLGENVARLAHGFKNAVHSLRGFTRLIQPRLSSSERDLNILDGLRMAIDRLEDLARATLGSTGSAPGVRRETDQDVAPRIVHEVVSEVSASFPEIRWSLSLGGRLPAVQASPALLREVLTIVVRNAAEAMEGRGEVAVEAAPNGGTLEIRVRDHGPGIPEAAREKIFEPGYTTKPDGHGFGLFLARRLLESHGGYLKVRPGEGGGTLCSIKLPLSEGRLTA